MVLEHHCRHDDELKMDIVAKMSKLVGLDDNLLSGQLATVCVEREIVGCIRKNIAHFQTFAKRGDDVAKRAVSFAKQLVSSADDGRNRIVKKKADLLNVTSQSLQNAIERLDDGGCPVLRLQKERRRDIANYRRLIVDLWHDQCDEIKGKSKRCFRRVAVPADEGGGYEFHRIRHRSGTMDDCFSLAMSSKRFLDWKAQREASGMPSIITKRRFVAAMCKCVRPADRKYCVCWRHDGARELVAAFVRQAPSWHTTTEHECECHVSCTLTSASLGAAGVATTCGIMSKITINDKVQNSTLDTCSYRCVKGECNRCASLFPSCPVLWDTKRTATWRAYELRVKLRRGEVLDRNGMLANGQRPKKARELCMKTGTRYQYMSYFKREWKKYLLHNYNSKFDAAVTSVLPRVLRRGDLVLWSDFSAFANLRYAKELTCQQGHRCSLYTSVSLFGNEFSDVGYATDVTTMSHLAWNEDVVQDVAAVHAHRTAKLKRIIEDRPERVFDVIYQVSDKCYHFRSRQAVRANDEWLQEDGKRRGVRTLVCMFKATGHSGCPADGEGGKDKRVVSDFIADEDAETWRERLNRSWPESSPKPVIDSAALASMVAEHARGKTKFERSFESETNKTIENETWTINKRWYYSTGDWKVDHSKTRFDMKPISDMNSFFCWRFEVDDPGVVYLRKRPCVCSKCVMHKWGECTLLVLGEGGSRSVDSTRHTEDCSCGSRAWKAATT